MTATTTMVIERKFGGGNAVGRQRSMDVDSSSPRRGSVRKIRRRDLSSRLRRRTHQPQQRRCRTSTPPPVTELPMHMVRLAHLVVLFVCVASPHMVQSYTVPCHSYISSRTGRAATPATSFQLPSPKFSPSYSTWLTSRNANSLALSSSSSSWEEDDDDDDIDGFTFNNDVSKVSRLLNRDPETGKWQLTNSFEFLIHQCSLQSLLYLMVSALHDRHTALWLEEFTAPVIYKRLYTDSDEDKALETMASAYDRAMNTKSADDGGSNTAPTTLMNLDSKEIKLLNYHGVGAINTTRFPTWQSYFESLLKEDAVTYQIETRRASFDLEIDPLSLSRRLLSVRTQIANEFVQDLDLIAEMSISQQKQVLATEDDDSNDDTDGDSPWLYTTSSISGGGGGGSVKLERFNALSLQQTVDDNSMKPSPLRMGNYDLLLQLATQEAIHRIINKGPQYRTHDGGNDVVVDEELSLDDEMIEFLEMFYSRRLLTHFTGSTSRYNRATDFLDELLDDKNDGASRMLGSDGMVVSFANGMITNIGSRGGSPATTIVRAILKQREVVANEWIDIALDVPDQHMEIQKLQLDRQVMASTTPKSSSTPPTSGTTTGGDSPRTTSSWESFYGTSSTFTSPATPADSSSPSPTTTENDEYFQ